MKQAYSIAQLVTSLYSDRADQVDESVKAKASSAVHLDDISILSDESKFGAWLNTASEEALESFIAQCVPGRADNQIDYSCRGTCMLA